MTSVPNYTEPKQRYVYSLFLEQKYRKRQRWRERERERGVERGKEKVKGERGRILKLKDGINLKRKQEEDRVGKKRGEIERR